MIFTVSTRASLAILLLFFALALGVLEGIFFVRSGVSVEAFAMSLLFGIAYGNGLARVFGKRASSLSLESDGLTIQSSFGQVAIYKVETIARVAILTMKGSRSSVAIDVFENDQVLGYVAPSLPDDSAETLISSIRACRRNLPMESTRPWGVRDVSFWQSATWAMVVYGSAFAVGGHIGGGTPGVLFTLMSALVSVLAASVFRSFARNRLL